METNKKPDPLNKKPDPLESIRESLSDRSAYISLERDGELVLDGRFTIAEMKAIVAAVEQAEPKAVG